MRAWLFIFLVLFSTAATADISLYGAVGTALQFPGSLRLGIDSWELGLLDSDVIGFDKIYPLDHGIYVAFGPALTNVSPSPGFFGGFGVEWNLFWGLTFRAEADGAGCVNGFAKGELNAGLGLHF